MEACRHRQKSYRKQTDITDYTKLKQLKMIPSVKLES